MHTKLLHGSAANRSDASRGLYICVYTAADAVPIARNPMPSLNEGRIVRGKEARFARLNEGLVRAARATQDGVVLHRDPPGVQAGRRVTEPFPAVTEAAAKGETAELFADIRATIGVRVVNLVWRHLATIDGALPWAWSAVKPLYLQGMADRAAVRFRESMSLPVLRLAGRRAAEERRRRAGELRSLQHDQSLRPRRAGRVAARRDRRGGHARDRRAPAGPDVVLPKLASADDVAPETWALVLRLNRFGDPRQIILASMYRHLAHAPAFLRQVEAALAPVEADGSLARAIAANRARRA